MNTVDFHVLHYKFVRGRTLATLEAIEKLPDPQAALAWRPGPGRAHIGWQFMHVGVTEDLFASERLNPGKAGLFQTIWPRFRGGSVPDDNVPSAAEIRTTLAAARESLLETLAGIGEERLGDIPEALKERGLTIRDWLHIIGWHEAHHQGQAHITLNLYKARG